MWLPMIAGVAGGFGLAILLGWILGPTHKHKPVPKAVSHMCRTHKDSNENIVEKADVTMLLAVCGCGHTTSEEFAGNWKLEDFDAPVTIVKTKGDDITQLRKMAGLPSEDDNK